MNTWIIWMFNSGFTPKVQTKEVQAYDIPGAISMACVDSSTVFAVTLKGVGTMAPLVQP